MQKSPWHRLKRLLQGFALFLIGVLSTILFYHTQATQKMDCVEQYYLTNSSLDCTTYGEASNRLSTLDTTLTDQANLYIAQGKAKRVSVFVRDLTSLQTAGVDENDRYDPASLLKMPVMMAYYKLSEINPSVLSEQLVFATSTSFINNSTQNFVPGHPLTNGQNYTVEQLIENMIINSDNDSTSLLVSHLDPGILSNTMVDLGIQIPGSAQNHDFLTAKTYSGILRQLYNATYLNRTDSEKALELLASSTFEGISEPLPHNVVVADKFGEREVDNSDGSVQTRELHNCGIVYKEKKPYSICIMTEGADFNQLLSIIENLSQITYNQI